jgi:PAS domain S-box-containing protein
MKDTYKTKEELIKGLEDAHQKIVEIEKCRDEFRKVQEKYEKLLHSAPDALVFVNNEGKIVMINARFEKMFGYDNEEIAGQGLEILIPERFRSKHHKHVADFFLNPGAHPMGSDFEIYALKKSGEEFPVDVNLSPLHTDEGLLITAAVRDITKRKQAEEQVELNYHIQRVINAMLKISLEPLSLEEQFERILDLMISIPHLSLQSKVAIYLVDDDNPEVLVMKAHRGFPEEELIPCKRIPFGTCLCGLAVSLSKTIYSDHIDNRHDIHDEGQFPHGHYCVPIVSGGHSLGLLNVYIKEGHKRNGGEEEFLSSVSSTLASIIKHDKTDQEKKLLQVQLAQSEKLAALGRFTANVAHEIRNPLTAIGGFARRLDKNIPEGTKEKEYAALIITEVTRLEGILKNVLAFSRDITPQMEKHGLHEMIDNILKINEEVFREKSIAIHASYNDMTPIFIDETHVHEAVENIVLNAIDSMPAGGSLYITIDKRVIEGIPFIYVEIKDTGVGIPHDKLNMIFEPFYTTKITQKGTGLGLSITKKFVEEHGGFVEVESVEGTGTTFTLYFPYRLTP